MLVLPNPNHSNIDSQKQKVLTAIVQAKQDGLSNEEIIVHVREALSSSMVDYAETVLQQMDFKTKLSRSVIEFDLEFLFQVIYSSVMIGTSDEEILSICAEYCTLNQYEFVRYALEYIHVNRVPSQWEQSNIHQKAVQIADSSSVEDLFQYIDSLKNIYLKQIGYEVVQENLYKLFLSHKPIHIFTDLANKTRDYFIKKYCYRTAVLVARVTGQSINLQLTGDGSTINEPKSLESKTSTHEIIHSQISTMEQAGKLLVDTLEDFSINAKYVDAKTGPTFNRIKVKLGRGVSYKKVEDIGNDLVQQLGEELDLKVAPMVSVVPGGVVFDIPRLDRQFAYFRDYITFDGEPDIHSVSIPGGVDVDGTYVEIPLYSDNVTHILGGGRTRGGKSQFEKAAILYLVRRYPPSLVQLALSDVKRVTFGKFDGLPHLVAPVARDAESTANLLDYLVEEMELRYQEFERHSSIETIAQYNLRFASGIIMPRIVCLIDECFDLLSDDNYCDRIEGALMKLLAKAGGAGIHVLLYTQRPDKNVIDPLIRSNFPAKTAFVTTRPEDSCIILGDDKDKRAVYLLGYGDFLYKTTEVVRLQALYVADDEDPEYFKQLLIDAKNQDDSYTAWESGLDFDEFVASLSGEGSSHDRGKSKATAVTKTKQFKTDFEGSFSFNVQLDDSARNSILNLHQKGYQLDEIVKAVFNLSRHDGRSYKKFRNVVEGFLNSLQGGEGDDI
ncbi:DNA translocase FtsK (plasmid) [Brasilonema octagenarum UFV-E1]|uniref:DNA translocase FtsK n=2 Tax=Brasilonema TaxID=383614 RepID=A0A856MSF4_9CYAN|nr:MULTISPECIES: DNA translocase FtsK [Brasilonema]NMF65724.1 DNA translocase FtsK [Brasilonema octagenarum UFV-OR1]QDL12567.1 DNA translocase FtsK [Brasilonema sennae CENA114]QDL18961.1 DNA translocase FtsK [Brasilonema octagenarum UFV-E1]